MQNARKNLVDKAMTGFGSFQLSRVSACVLVLIECFGLLVSSSRVPILIKEPVAGVHNYLQKMFFLYFIQLVLLSLKDGEQEDHTCRLARIPRFEVNRCDVKSRNPTSPSVYRTLWRLSWLHVDQSKNIPTFLWITV